MHQDRSKVNVTIDLGVEENLVKDLSTVPHRTFFLGNYGNASVVEDRKLFLKIDNEHVYQITNGIDRVPANNVEMNYYVEAIVDIIATPVIT